jgi:hypothetical protein
LGVDDQSAARGDSEEALQEVLLAAHNLCTNFGEVEDVRLPNDDSHQFAQTGTANPNAVG